MTTSLIDSAFNAAISAAQSLGDAVVRISPVAVAENQTVQTDTLVYRGQKGFRVLAAIQIGGYRATRIHETLPALRETEWPADIEAEAVKWVEGSLSAGKAHVGRFFDPTDLVTLLSLFISSLAAAGNDQTAIATAKPKLVAVYAWTQEVQALAAAGQRMFPRPPFTFAEVIAETHS